MKPSLQKTARAKAAYNDEAIPKKFRSTDGSKSVRKAQDAHDATEHLPASFIERNKHKAFPLLLFGGQCSRTPSFSLR